VRSPLSPRLIRLATSRYPELQGLLTIADAVFPLYMGVMMVMTRWMEQSDVSDWWALVLGLPLLLWVVLLFCYVRPRVLAYYAARFGRVHGRPSAVVGPWRYQGLITGALLADAHRPWLTAITAMALLGAWPAWIAWRDWPYRWHWLPSAVIASIVAADMSRMPSYHVALQHSALWAFAVGAVSVFAGLGDHLLLIRTLRPVPHQAPGHEAPSTEAPGTDFGL
jgi:hypothetical protein